MTRSGPLVRTVGEALPETGPGQEAARPTLDFDGRFGSTTGPWTTDMFVEAVFKSLAEKK